MQIGWTEGPSSTRPVLENQSVQIQASTVLRGAGCWVRVVASGSLSWSGAASTSGTESSPLCLSSSRVEILVTRWRC